MSVEDADSFVLAGNDSDSLDSNFELSKFLPDKNEENNGEKGDESKREE